MATHDSNTDDLVVQVVYDGAPRSGKTASMRSLGKILRRPVETPNESNGRTLYFDWLEYVGGRRHGRPIKCRVVSVPGQSVLAHRREALLAIADVVIFVMDATAEGLAPSLRQWVDLQRLLKSRDREVPVLVQLNKQDLDQTVSADTLSLELGSEIGDRCRTTVATDGEGVRETFVLAVGEAIKSLTANGVLHPERSEREPGEVKLVNPTKLRETLQKLDPEKPKAPRLRYPDRGV